MGVILAVVAVVGFAIGIGGVIKSNDDRAKEKKTEEVDKVDAGEK